jgi:signal transduction histidine kinase
MMAVRELIFPPGATRHDWVLDSALTLGLGMLTLPVYWINYLSSYSELEIAASLLMLLPLVIRRHSPIISLAGITVAAFLQLLASNNMSASLIAIPVISYSMARWVPGYMARIVVVIGMVGSVLGPVRWLLRDPGHASIQQWVWVAMGIMICFGLVITPYAIGRRIRESSEAYAQRVANAEQRYRAELAEREHQTRLAEGRVRTQIARELHDIVAHSLSVMIVQAEGGKALARKRPEAAGEALDTIAETGREALTEMRRILGVLRADPQSPEAAEYAPAPSLTDIPELVARTSDRATLTIRGNPPRVSPALQLTVYRVVQEALTNFLKHAGPQAHAEVLLSYGRRQIRVEVNDDGLGAAATSENPGHGLRGMRERVSSMGGQLSAQPRTSGGFQVRAVIPFVLSEPRDPTEAGEQ